MRLRRLGCGAATLVLALLGSLLLPRIAASQSDLADPFCAELARLEASCGSENVCAMLRGHRFALSGEPNLAYDALSTVPADDPAWLDWTEKPSPDAPSSPLATYLRAHALWRAGESEIALEMLEPEVAHHFDNPTTNLFAIIAAERGDENLPLEYLHALDRTTAKYGYDLLANLAYVYLMLGEADEATRYFDEALERAPDNVIALTGRATARAMMCDMEAALSDYRAAERQAQAMASAGLLAHVTRSLPAILAAAGISEVQQEELLAGSSVAESQSLYGVAPSAAPLLAVGPGGAPSPDGAENNAIDRLVTPSLDRMLFFPQRQAIADLVAGRESTLPGRDWLARPRLVSLQWRFKAADQTIREAHPEPGSTESELAVLDRTRSTWARGALADLYEQTTKRIFKGSFELLSLTDGLHGVAGDFGLNKLMPAVSGFTAGFKAGNEFQDGRPGNAMLTLTKPFLSVAVSQQLGAIAMPLASRIVAPIAVGYAVEQTYEVLDLSLDVVTLNFKRHAQERQQDANILRHVQTANQNGASYDEVWSSLGRFGVAFDSRQEYLNGQDWTRAVPRAPQPTNRPPPALQQTMELDVSPASDVTGQAALARRSPAALPRTAWVAPPPPPPPPPTQPAARLPVAMPNPVVDSLFPITAQHHRAQGVTMPSTQPPIARTMLARQHTDSMFKQPARGPGGFSSKKLAEACTVMVRSIVPSFLLRAPYEPPARDKFDQDATEPTEEAR